MWLPGLGHVRCCDRCIDRDWSWVHAGSEEALEAEQAAMKSDGAAVILNTASDEPLEASVFGPDTWTHLYILSGSARLSIAPGHLAIASANTGPNSNITIVQDKGSPQCLAVGEFYSFGKDGLVPLDEPKIACGAFLHCHRVQTAAAESRWQDIESSRRSRELSGLSLTDWEQAEGMLAMCSQYLQLIGKKLKDELPKAVFRELVQEPAYTIEATLNHMLRAEFENLVALSVHEPAERIEQRQRLQGQLLTLDSIKQQVTKLSKLALRCASGQQYTPRVADHDQIQPTDVDAEVGDIEEEFFESTSLHEHHQ